MFEMLVLFREELKVRVNVYSSINGFQTTVISATCSFTLYLFFSSVFLVQQHNVLISTSRQEHSAGLNVSKLKEMVSGVAFCVFDDVV